jgi:DNA-directed RNA polymerase
MAPTKNAITRSAARRNTTRKSATISRITSTTARVIKVTIPLLRTVLHIMVTTANINSEKRLMGAFFVFSQLCGI